MAYGGGWIGILGKKICTCTVESNKFPVWGEPTQFDQKRARLVFMWVKAVERKSKKKVTVKSETEVGRGRGNGRGR